MPSLRTFAGGICLFMLLTKADDFDSTNCSKVASCSSCINYVNSDLFDGTKCLPTAGSGGVCQSWSDVQDKSYAIDYACNQATLPQAEKDQVQEMISIKDWAFYPYTVQPTDTLLEKMQIFEDSGTKTLAVVGYDAKTNSIITSFRGSDNIKNWIEDADFVKTDYNNPECNGCSVHAGFYKCYNSLKDEMNAYLQNTMFPSYPNARVVVTGHSLGSGESMFAAIDQQNMGKAVHFFSFGCPRTGDSDFAKYFNSKISTTNIRVVYKNDPVPTLPGHFLGFDHAGTEVHYYDCSGYVAYPFNKDDYPNTNILDADDHSSYRCIVSSNSLINLEEESLFLQ